MKVEPLGVPYVVDSACYCDRCTARTKEKYALKATCSNCRTPFVVVIRKGDKRPSGPECPGCGVNDYGVMWGAMVDVPAQPTPVKEGN